jgi:hypothetical protein
MDLPDFLKKKKDNTGKTDPVEVFNAKNQAPAPIQTPERGQNQVNTQNTNPPQQAPGDQREVVAKNGEKKPEIKNPQFAVEQTNLDLLDVIAPEEIELDFDYIKVNDVYFKTLFVSGYPRFVAPGWLEPIVNFDSSLDISFYIYPVEGKSVLDDLRRKIAEMEAEIATDLER